LRRSLRYLKQQEVSSDSSLATILGFFDWLSSCVQTLANDSQLRRRVQRASSQGCRESCCQGCPTVGLKVYKNTLAIACPAELDRVGIAAVGTAVSEHWYGTGRTLGPSRVPDGKGYAGQTGTMTKELKRSCQLMWNYTTSTIPSYQPPHTCRLKYASSSWCTGPTSLRRRFRPMMPGCEFFATILKPVATAAPTDKYRKPAGVGPAISSSESKAERDDATRGRVQDGGREQGRPCRCAGAATVS